MSDSIIYRLSWEMINAQRSLDFEFGVFTYDRIPEHWWYRIEKEGTDLWDQYETLKKWSETKEQPIRNVKLEQAITPITEWAQITTERKAPDAD